MRTSDDPVRHLTDLTPAASINASDLLRNAGIGAALRLHIGLKARLVRDKMTAFYETIERPLVPVVAAMEDAGIKVDRAASIVARFRRADRRDRAQGADAAAGA